MKLLDKTKLFNMSKTKSENGIVYFLFRGNEIVYIGSAINLSSRISVHKKDKDFNRYTFIMCEKNQRKIIESRYILKFNPQYNYGRLSAIFLKRLKKPTKVKQPIFTPIKNDIDIDYEIGNLISLSEFASLANIRPDQVTILIAQNKIIKTIKIGKHKFIDKSEYPPANFKKKTRDKN